MSFFFFNDTATTEIYTLSLHDALPIWENVWMLPSGAVRASESSGSQPAVSSGAREAVVTVASSPGRYAEAGRLDRKSTRLNSSHLVISYAVFCLAKKTDHATGVHAPPL